jgi:hypothetical protein
MDVDLDAAFSELVITLVTPFESNVTYIVDVLRIRVVGRNANLLGFTFQATSQQQAEGVTRLVDSMQPANFSAQVMLYSVQLAVGIDEFRFTSLVDSTASLLVTTRILLADSSSTPPLSSLVVIPVRSGEVSPVIRMSGVAQLQVEFNITAEDGTTHKTYTFIVRRYTESTGMSSSTAIAQPSSGSSTGAVSSTGASTSFDGSTGMRTDSSTGVASVTSPALNTVDSTASAASIDITHSSSGVAANVTLPHLQSIAAHRTGQWRAQR